MSCIAVGLIQKAVKNILKKFNFHTPRFLFCIVFSVDDLTDP